MQSEKVSDHSRSVVIATEQGKTYYWRVTTIWEAANHELQVEDIPVEALLTELEQDRWFQQHRQPTILNIIKHFQRLQDADLSYPIILSPTGRVMDGIHRLAKAWLLGVPTIKAIRLTSFPESDPSLEQE